MHISIAFACIFKVILIMNGEADTSCFVSMYVYMHLAFKELNYMHLTSSYILKCVANSYSNIMAMCDI